MHHQITEEQLVFQKTESSESLNTILKKIHMVQEVLIDLDSIDSEPETILSHLDQLIKLHKTCLIYAHEPRAFRIDERSHIESLLCYAKKAILLLQKIVEKVELTGQQTFSFYRNAFNHIYLETMTPKEIKQWLVEMHFSYLGALREITLKSNDMQEIKMQHELITTYLTQTDLSALIQDAFSENLQDRMQYLENLLQIIKNIDEFTQDPVPNRKRKLCDISGEKEPVSESGLEVLTKLSASQYPKCFFSPTVCQTSPQTAIFSSTITSSIFGMQP